MAAAGLSAGRCQVSGLQYLVTMLGVLLVAVTIDAFVKTTLQMWLGKDSRWVYALGAPATGLLAFYGLHTFVMGWAR